MSLRDELLPHQSRPYPDGVFPKSLSLYSILSFSWVTPLMQTGDRRPLEEDDVFKLPHEDRCSEMTDRVRANFIKKGSLLSAIQKEWLWTSIQAGLWKILNDGSQFTGPILMSWILRGLTEFSVLNLMILAFAMYISQITGAVGEGQYFQTGMRVGMQLRSTLMAMIFRKSLRLSVHSRLHEVSGGKMTNMISSDTESLQSFCEVMHVLWSAPLRIVTSMVLLYYLMGSSALFGAAVVVGMIPAQKKLVGMMTARVRLAQKFTDDRLKLVGEAFEGIQLVKCYGWEEAFRSRIDSTRAQELSHLYKYALIRAGNAFLISAIPVLVAVTSFSAYSLIPSNPPLTAVQAFTALSLFQVLRFPLMQLPSVINSLGACKVSLGRIEGFLKLDELKKTSKPPSDDNVVKMSNCSFKWPTTDFCLTVPSLSIKQSDLIVVVGHTASGKSTLLQALLGHIPLTSGSFELSESQAGIAYCPQLAWIFNGTVRENVVFGQHPVDELRYRNALAAVDFLEDLKWMPAGDQTEIGERGVNLSGGQKHRISLARAVYVCDTDFVLLDDPLAALDATVANTVYQKAILGEMKDRTRILVTNRLEIVLPTAKLSDSSVKFIVVSNGTVSAAGTYNELADKGVPEFVALLEKVVSDTPTSSPSFPSNASVLTKPDAPAIATPSGDQRSGVLVQKEDRQTGAVSSTTISVYSKAMGYFNMIVLSYIATEILRVCASIWLSKWSGSPQTANDPESVIWFLGVYVVLSMAQLGLSLFSQVMGAVSGNRAARKLHEKMFDRLIIAPMRFFTATPLGRILNRFSKDVGDMDKNLAPMFGMTLTVSMGLVSTLGILAGTAYYTVIGFVPVLVAFYYCQAYYRASSREIKRMDSISRSPIYAHFQQVQDGISTVVAFARTNFVTWQNAEKIDNHIRFNLAQMSTNRWLGIRLEFYGGALVLLTALFIVSARNVINAGKAGLALSTALQVTGALGGIVRLSAMLENSLNSIERINEYSSVASEIQNIGSVAPKNWPSAGAIDFKSVVVYYKPPTSDMDQAVLRSISFSIAGGMKVGVIGRTGAGKTSLILTLFRIIETHSGQITIDGIDISQISLRDLRRALGIIPQDPIVFEGTLRDNIDPFSQYSDDEVGAALAAAHLTTLPLLHAVVAGGKNLSAGQRQQICLARVVLRRPKILVLDEATSSLDRVTDELVSETVREQFRTSTVITIAHRLHTIIDSDLLIGLDKGEVAEIGTPKDLIDKQGGLFASLVGETGSSTSRYLRSRISA